MEHPSEVTRLLQLDCTDNIGCNAYFDAIMEPGEVLNLSTCNYASWDTALSVWSGENFETLELCVDDSCDSLQSELSFIAQEHGTYRFRLGGFGGSSGEALLAYDGTFGIDIVGSVAVPTLGEYGLGALIVLLLGAGMVLNRRNRQL